MDIELSAFSPRSDRAISAHSHIARALGIDILGGELKPGDTLPSEAELLLRFGISRTVLREVLKTLTAKGFVASKPRVGTKVLPSLHWNFFDPDVLNWKLALGYDAAFRDDLAEIRRAIEPRAAALAAKRRTDSDIIAMRDWISQMRKVGHSRRSFADADLGLHLAVSAASGNALMRSIGAIIEAALFASFTLSSSIDEQEELEKSLDRHEAIVDAIERQDEKGAAAHMLSVIDHGTSRIAARITR